MSHGYGAIRVIRIEDAHDSRLANYAGVREPALLRNRGLLIAEGRFVVRRLLTSRRVRSLSLLLNDAALNGLGDALEQAASTFADGPHIDVYVASPDVITSATGFNMHRGCLALAERPADVPLDALAAQSEFIVVLERVVDPDNVGSVFRNAEAFAAEAVLLSPGCGDPFYRKAIRTSSGAALTVPFASATPWPEALEQLRAAGFTVAGLTGGASTDIGDFTNTPAARGRVALLMGSEGHGLTGEALAHTDVQVRIPMSPTLDSLNIATAAGIALHRLHEARARG